MRISSALNPASGLNANVGLLGSRRIASLFLAFRCARLSAGTMSPPIKSCRLFGVSAQILEKLFCNQHGASLSKNTVAAF